MQLSRAENVHSGNQNLGFYDRMIRFVVGSAMLGIGMIYLVTTPEMFTSLAVQQGLVIAILLSVYPLLTAILGVDPIYHHFSIRSCREGGRNQCGSFPYQVKAVVKQAPKYCESGSGHSLESCQDDPAGKPHHATWKVEGDPMLWPDDAAMEEFAARQRRKKKESS